MNKLIFILVALVFINNCSFNEKGLNVTRNNISNNEINSSNEYSFEEYVNLLLNNNKSKNYPDINNITD